MKWTMVATTMAAGFVSALLMTAPANARDMVCVGKLDGCINRCIKNQDTVAGESACVTRTCEPQYRNCEKAAGGSTSGSGSSGGSSSGGSSTRNPSSKPPREASGPPRSPAPRAPREPKGPREPRGPKGGVVVR
jgi:hypothetical protein